MTEPTLFRIPDKVRPDSLAEIFRESFAVKKVSATTEQREWFDTFDWRLFKAGLELYKSGNMAHIIGPNQAVQDFRINTGTVKTFVHELPDSRMQSRLKPIVEMRALLPQLKAGLRSELFSLLNADEKTVVRARFEEYTLGAGKNVQRCRLLLLSPVVGYKEDLAATKSLLIQQGFTKITGKPFEYLLQKSGLNPNWYTTRINVLLQPGDTICLSIKKILRFLYKIMEQNRPGMLQDVDSEFLHDFRVATRRTRSALGQIKDVFPDRTVNRFKRDLSHVGQLSNRLRDLDVYLLQREEYRHMLPKHLRDGIEFFFEDIGRKRANEFKKFKRSLNSARVQSILSDWQKFINLPTEKYTSAANSARPTLEMARFFIFKKYRKILRKGKTIGAHSEDKKLHELRIDCKKLRYLMEFFYSLFPGDQITLLIRQLKKLQDNLGRFNDLSVQKDFLQDWLDKYESQKEQKVATAAAVGCLIGLLESEQQQVRLRFHKTFDRFTDRDIKKVFRKLFRGQQGSRVTNGNDWDEEL